MTEENKSVASIDLSAGAAMVCFVIRGKEYEVEAFEAMDDLAIIDGKHENDLHHCRDCGKDFIIPRDVYGRIEEYQCPNAECPSNQIVPETGERKGLNATWNPGLLNEVAAYVRDRYGVPTCGRVEAAAFYNAVVSTCKTLKKNAGSTAD